jgi:nucleoside-diphosphate-sugar epimerase
MTKHAVVLGAGGFIGRAVCRALIHEAQYEGITAHYRQPPSIDRLPNDRVTWRALDLVHASAAEIADLIEQSQADVVINCAGATFGPLTTMQSVNVDVVSKVAAALRGRTDVHLIHLGSAAEYGAQRTGRSITERATALPVSDYGIAKLKATQLLLEAGDAGQLTVTVLRVFNPLGRGSAAHTLPGRAALEIEAALQRGDDVVRLGSLGSWRDYVDTRDVASAVAAAFASQPAGAVVLNVGRGEAVLTRDLVNSLATIAGYTGRIIESDDGSSRSTPVPWQRADITATTSWLGWRPQHNIDASLRDLWSGVREGVST